MLGGTGIVFLQLQRALIYLTQNVLTVFYNLLKFSKCVAYKELEDAFIFLSILGTENLMNYCSYVFARYLLRTERFI